MQNSSAARATVDVGTVIADTYTVESLLGRGGMGSVFLASHNRLPGKKVAIKILHADLADDEVLARFKREAQIATQLDHPNIVRVDDFLTLPDGTPCMLLEYLQGETLASRLRAGPLPLDQALSIVRQVGSALAAAHRAGIVHRDLKPQNIFLVPTEHDGHAAEVAKVLDFGISKIRGSQTVQTQESSLLGTPQYMAPEQATGQHSNVDERTDVFAFGAIVYEMLSGQPAFQGTSIPEVVFKVVYEEPVPLTTLSKTVPTAVTDAITMAMAKKSDARYPNVNAFIEALTGQPISLFKKKLPLPDSTLAAGSHNKGGVAFDATIGSGDHADAMKAGIAATVASERGANTVPETVAPPAPAKRTGLYAAIAIAGVAVAGAVVFVATRGGHDELKPPVIAEHVASATPPPPPPPVGSAEASGAGVASGSAIGSGVASGSATKPKVVAEKPPVEKADTKVHADAAEALADIKTAESALAGGDCHSATTGANAVKLLADPGGDSIRHAWTILGVCACKSSDLGGVNSALRNLSGASAKRVKDACAQAGMNL